MTTYIKDLIAIPERVHGGDFVLKLTEGVGNPESTLGDYLVTDQLRDCFDAALDFIKGAVQANSSKAAYLHGSFGSGKSHFMAVLHLLLQGNPVARSKEGLEEVVSKHESWIEGKKFFLVPYHMIGQSSMEAAVLGGYVRHVLKLHPNAPIPGVYRSEGLFRDAQEHRENLGDEKFFEGLNRSDSGGGDSGWGDLETTWDAELFEAALVASPESKERSRLIGALVQAYFKSYTDVARGGEETFVSLDDGLSIISQHAESLGYDALVLFLDELILWLATHAADQHFLNTEGPKVSKLVEAESAVRPIPIISFVARQRDLRELVGENVTGAEELGFTDVLRWWEARFHKITLEDGNLPEIAAHRVLKPKSEAARQEIEESWEQTKKIRDEVLSILLTPRSDRSVFRKVYPFSPALVETLVAVSSVLQRERTALKVMLQLLVNQRDTLKLGEIIPVGDLFDVIAHGDEPFTEGMRLHFENAKRLYHQKLLPMLESEHGLNEEQVKELPFDDKKATAFRADDRLIKTLLLAALGPEVEVLKNLNSEKLAALNHGSVKSPIPGRERQEVLRRLKKWASQVGEIKIGDEADPNVTLQLSGVDTAGILENAKVADNTGNRRRKIRELLFEQLGIEDKDDLFLEHDVLWKGTRHRFQVVFGNVRELTSESLSARGGGRKAVLDFPFDEPGHTPNDDLTRLEDFRGGGKPSRTLVWIPAFFSTKAQRELGTLVILDEVLKNDDAFRRYASQLSAIDQSQAKVLLDNQRRQLRNLVIRYLEGTYGVATPPPGSVDESHTPAEHFQSLDPSFSPQPPVGANLKQAFETLLHQMLQSQYPAHPDFGTELKLNSLKKVQEEVARAVQDPDGRVPIERSLRSLMLEISVPLKLGEMGETHFVVGRHWYTHFNREIEDGAELTVRVLREAISRPKPMGLTAAAEDLLIMLYADQSNRSFVLHGGPFVPKLDDLRDELELRIQPLPDSKVWETAQQRAAKIFGITVSPLRNASNVSELANRLHQETQHLEVAQAITDRLSGLCDDYEIMAGECKRLITATSVANLLRGIADAVESEKIDVLARVEVETSLEAMGTSLRKAAPVNLALQSTRWDLFEGVSRITGERSVAAQTLRKELVDALSHDELAVALATRLNKLEGDAVRILTPPKPPAPPSPRSSEPGRTTIESLIDQALSVPEARAKLEHLLSLLNEEDKMELDLSYTLWKKADK